MLSCEGWVLTLVRKKPRVLSSSKGANTVLQQCSNYFSNPKLNSSRFMFFWTDTKLWIVLNVKVAFGHHATGGCLDKMRICGQTRRIIKMMNILKIQLSPRKEEAVTNFRYTMLHSQGYLFFFSFEKPECFDAFFVDILIFAVSAGNHLSVRP